jgi:hypothetical protein
MRAARTCYLWLRILLHFIQRGECSETLDTSPSPCKGQATGRWTNAFHLNSYFSLQLISCHMPCTGIIRQPSLRYSLLGLHFRNSEPSGWRRAVTQFRTVGPVTSLGLWAWHFLVSLFAGPDGFFLNSHSKIFGNDNAWSVLVAGIMLHLSTSSEKTRRKPFRCSRFSYDSYPFHGAFLVI